MQCVAGCVRVRVAVQSILLSGTEPVVVSHRLHVAFSPVAVVTSEAASLLVDGLKALDLPLS